MAFDMIYHHINNFFFFNWENLILFKHLNLFNELRHLI